MHFFRNESEHKYVEQLTSVIEVFADRAVELDESRGFPFQNIKDLKACGYTTLTLPKQYGGLGKGLYEFLLCQEKIGQYCGPTALSIGWHNGTVLQLQDGRRGWSKEVLEETFVKIANGALINRAASEPITGSPTRGGRPTTTARKVGSTYIINGRKNYTSMAPMLDLFLVSAWVEERKEIGWFLIEKEAQGLSIEKTWDMLSMQGTGSEDLVLQDVVVDEKYLVESGKKGTLFDEGWLLHIPACYLGIASAARHYALNFATTHSPNSLQGSISQLPHIKKQIGEIEMELLEARHFLYSVASQWEAQPDNHDMLHPQLGAVKRSVINSALSIVDKSMRIVGALSLKMSCPLQRYYRDVRAGLHNPPMEDAVINLLAETALKNKSASAPFNGV